MITPEQVLDLGDEALIRDALQLEHIADDSLGGYLELAASLLQEDAAKAGVVLAVLGAVSADRNLLPLAAEASYLEARSCLVQGRLEDALSRIDRAAALWIRAGEPVKAARTGLGRMNVLDDLGRHSEAIRVGEELLARLDQLGEAELAGEEVVWLRAAALENMGVGRGYLGQHEAALAAYQQAEEVYRNNGMADEVARPMANRGVELVELGRLDEAITTLRMAADAFAGQGDNLYSAKCLAYQARALMLAGKYTASAAAADQAGEYLAAQPPTTEYARIQLVRAETLVSMNLLADAVQLTEGLINQFAEAGFEHDLAAAHFVRAVAHTRIGDSAEAITGFIEAEKRFESVGAAAMAAVAKLGRSQLLDDAEAEQLTLAAIEVLRSSGRPTDRVAAELRLSQLAGSSSVAMEHLDEAARVLDAHDLPHLRWKERSERGRRLREMGDIAAAHAAYVESLRGLDEMRRTVDQDLQRLPFMGGRDRVHQDLAELLADAGDVVAALQVTENARARTLVERMRGELAGSVPGPRSEGLDEIYDEMLESPSISVDAARRRARALESLATSRGETRASAPRFLGRGCFVTYQYFGDEVVAFVAGGGEVRLVRELATRQSLVGLMRRLDAQWRRFEDPSLAARQQSHILAATQDVLQRLHLALIAPLDVLDEPGVTFVPIGAIANVPFGALHDGTCYLIERMPVAIAPSRQAAELAEGSARPGRHRLVMGISDEHTPHIYTEAASIATIQQSATVLLDEAATTAEFLERAAGHDILHIASHGIERPDNPLFGAIRFRDRWLTAAEITGVDLDGQTVVLSACSSGTQFSAGGEDELIGLPRAFLAAGAGAVVVNLWHVEDSSAADLMAAFHKELGTASVADALRAAQMQAMERRPHPYWWAASTVIGAQTNDQEMT